jgi:hypothetical protein
MNDPTIGEIFESALRADDGSVLVVQRVMLEDLQLTMRRLEAENERLRKDVEELTLILDSHRTKPTDGSLSRWVCQT